MQKLIVFIIIIGLLGCDEESAQGNGVCSNPVEISGSLVSGNNNASILFILSFEDTVDVALKATSFVEKYNDLEVNSIFSSINGFSGNSSQDTLNNLQCEESVKSIQIDEPDRILFPLQTNLI